MSEMAQTADHLIVIGRGQLLADMSTDEFVRGASKRAVRVRSPQVDRLKMLISSPEVTFKEPEPSVLEVSGLGPEQIGEIAARNGVVLHELTPMEASLEEAFMELTRDELEYHAETPVPGGEPQEVAA
jgi:ABC-2 type transport system ATP-binding protein